MRASGNTGKLEPNEGEVKRVKAQMPVRTRLDEMRMQGGEIAGGWDRR